jgi:hypothetical protein
MDLPLQLGHELRCPHCRRWHLVIIGSVGNTTTSADQMLYWQCRGLTYFAGFIGAPGRYPTRRGNEGFRK